MTSQKKTPQELADLIGRTAAQRDLAARRLGIELVEMGPGRAVLRMTVQPDMVNSHGTCHGGIIFTLADSAFGYACNSFNRNSVAQHASIEFLRPVMPGTELTAVAELRSTTGRSSIYDMTVSDADGNAVALFRGLARTISGETVPGLTPPDGA
ncbi:MAG TPA: hydroxyphenylacetyl-CoA thioesterase PaaI [Ferrovibrio sp.]|jgi:acyl-CoA thioesterase|uniref:hydroxyphenylacetyl-CoA thioesterase PaaI n=1 Tax=Ferrovibrio sp. TaxID=1917215 RepID=UPI002ED3DB55